MLSRGDLTDDEWAVLEPLLPLSNNRCGRWRDHRQVINGIIHWLRTSCQWRELPECFGPWPQEASAVVGRRRLGAAAPARPGRR
ncbi:transposase [Streptomyces sichuanensis]|uniref:transposase n=1 Tax=Streptomyces sichuanensis TaxID=2871810 RepID=UPI003556B3F8